ncbi:MAG TPA: Nif3-like dinuclear metal center hexameric protein [Candidatus Monoglobus merdigallinarum]|uniref:GTP cyclohydrolase 1 type 2 homolog n=1 Tax=Candidatus Monoglobus merdigallinarum TaxID=2838698 RepID=A0A9D1PRW2_9FIRM|nr:Nif3-like dinuclear metal center hexameric protein [Candidatus Monoglobus merdigallinarum]
MPKVREIASYIEELAPQSLAESWDNVGLMVGDFEADVKNVFVTLDATSETVEEAIKHNADMIITHHPLIFTEIRHVTEQDVTGSIIINLIKNNIAVYSAHTNFDIANGGMNDILAEKLGLTNVRSYTEEECTDNSTGRPSENIGRVGVLEQPAEMADFVDYVKNALGCAAISYVGNPSDVVSAAAVCSGSGGDLIYNAYNAGADVYITSEIKHHQASLAIELGLNVIDAGHFETENIICGFMESYLKSRFPELNIHKSSVAPYKHR